MASIACFISVAGSFLFEVMDEPGALFGGFLFFCLKGIMHEAIWLFATYAQCKGDNSL